MSAALPSGPPRTTTTDPTGRSGVPGFAGALALGTAAAMFMTAIGAAYFGVRNNEEAFVPDTMPFWGGPTYAGVVILITWILGSMACEWAQQAVSQSIRRWGLMAWGLGAFMALAAMNLQWFLADTLGFGPGATSYATLVYALFIASGAMGVMAFVAALVGLARTAGGQISADQPHLGRACAVLYHLGMLSWAGTLGLIYLYK